jgi:TonB family protein
MRLASERSLSLRDRSSSANLGSPDERKEILKMFGRSNLITALFFLFVCGGLFGMTWAQGTADNDRIRDGLIGPVRRVRTETAKLAVKGGKVVEGPRVLLETATYDLKGNKIDNAYYSVESSNLTGREVYKYDDRGNITEMTLYNSDGTILSKEVYSYEFDAVGNWVKMTTSVAVIEGGKITYEPTEVTYRTITYFYEDNVAKIVQTSSALASGHNAASNAASNVANPTVASVKPSTGAVGMANKPVADSRGGAKDGKAVPPMTTVSPDRLASLTPAPAPKVPVEVAADAGTPVRVEADAPPPTPKPLLKPISGGVLNGRAISLPKPIYPEAARRAHVQGVVNVEVVVDVSGRVISARAVSGPALLHEAAVAAARQARFTPTLLSGQPVKVAGVITYNFVYEQ